MPAAIGMLVVIRFLDTVKALWSSMNTAYLGFMLMVVFYVCGLCISVRCFQTI